MKRITALLLCVALLLGGCGRGETSAAEPPAVVTVIEEETLLPAISEAESAAMANFMAVNRALVSGDRLYTLDFDASMQPVLACCRITETGLTDWTTLAENCVPEYLCQQDNALYYLNAGQLERLELANGTREVLAAGPFRSLQLWAGGLYVRDDAGGLLRLTASGSVAERLLDGPCDYAYILEEWILYQSEADGNSLRLRRLGSGEDHRIAAGPAYAPVCLNGLLYFSGDGCFRRLDMTEGEPRSFDLPELRGAAELFSTAEGWCARVALAGGGTEQAFLTLGKTVSYQPCGYQGYRLCDFVSEDLRVDAVYEADGRLRCFALCGQTGELRYFSGRQL